MTEEKKNEFAKVLADNGLNYSFGWNKNNEFEVEVHDGDWKHDHIRLNWVMQNNGYELVRETHIGPATDGDWYSAIHTFRKAEPCQATTIKED